MLGDGHVSDHQVLVHVNNEADVGYEKFVGRFGVYLRREKEIHRYFQEVGNNPKYRRRFQDYFEF